MRALAAEEQANPLTVAKAYQGFQDEGLIVVKRGVGMFVAAGRPSPPAATSERNRFLKEEWPEIRARMQPSRHRCRQSCSSANAPEYSPQRAWNPLAAFAWIRGFCRSATTASPKPRG